MQSTIAITRLRQKLSDWKIEGDTYFSLHRTIQLQICNGSARIFLRNNDNADSGYTRLENWRAEQWTRIDNNDTRSRLYLEALQRIEDFQTAAQVAIILSELGVLPKEKIQAWRSL